jgi:RNA polymerase sigma factor (sigma-70 family)
MIEVKPGKDIGDALDGHPCFLAVYPFARRAVEVRAIQASLRHGLPSCDRDDLEQDALTHLWQVFSKYDPTRAGVRTFIEVVVRRQFTSMLRSHSRHTQLAGLERRHVTGGNDFHAVELRVDIGRVLAEVSPLDRAVALSLAQCSAIETSRRLNISRAAAYRAIGRLRAAFTDAGLSFGGN